MAWNGLTPAPRADRFWSRVDKSGDCWLWTGNTFAARGGYGSFYDDKVFGPQRNRRAHRVSYELAHGVRLDSSETVCHSCDTPLCVRPDHLFLGTQQDNLRDMRDKGRANPGTSRGSAHYKAALTEEQVREIRRRYSAGEMPTALAREMGLTESIVGSAARGRTYRNVS